MVLKTQINLWDEKLIHQKGEEYIRKYRAGLRKDFSWLLDADKKYLKSDRADSINWGLPNQVIGNPTTANLFLCLLNPRVNDASADYEGFSGYVDKEFGNNPNEFFDDPDMYYQHIIQTNQNVLASELRSLQKETDFDQKWLDHEEDHSKIDPLREEYYLFSYYYYLLRDNPDSKKIDFYHDLRNKPEDYFDKLKICNLELFPYRTENSGGIRFQRGKNFKDLASSRYVASLIIDRIMDFSTSEKPVFIFRAYDQWSQVIFDVLRNRELVDDEEELIAKYNLLTDYFYEFSSNQNGAISESNIHKVLKLGEYEEIKDCMWTED